ncbi:hypothetical protein [Cohnella nanjingensis]|uniref:Uncharacterized protein n=1 Tax=Cohnella nanjingensis TaxID=1387779 RepID=A0A7X0RLM5_9BACL|nr:hypothetical protein [Cohnella nanjingensis]MBB6669777.1 hypothetical protein [Cohnella nanjingensis]
MDTNIGIALVVIVMIAALAGTILVGFSRKNQEENPDYANRPVRNWTKLSAYYLVTIIVLAILFLLLMNI